MQHRKVYIDDWSVLEKLCLASGVKRFGENWTSVCDFIRPKLQVEERQCDWFTPETCEAQYKLLYNECVKLQINCEDPVVQILQNLKSKCKTEGQLVEEQRNKYITLRNIVESIAKKEIIEDELLEKYYQKAQQGKKEKEENNRKYQELLKKRDLMKTEFEKTNISKSSNKQETKTDGSSPLTTSPLLSSLLNNPPAMQYRPTLSTTSIVPAKISQSTSRAISTEKIQSVSFNPEISEAMPSSSNSSTSVVRKLDFQDASSFTSEATSQRVLVKDGGVMKEPSALSTNEIPPQNESHNIENLMPISPSDAYLSEVDIPPETLLEVIDNLKEGTISLDKIIRDLEGTDEGIIINKTDLGSQSIDESLAAQKISETLVENEGTETPLPRSKTEMEEPSPDMISSHKSEEIAEIDDENKTVIKSSETEPSAIITSSADPVIDHDENLEIPLVGQIIAEKVDSPITKEEETVHSVILEESANVKINKADEINDAKLTSEPLVVIPQVDKIIENTTDDLNENTEINLPEKKVQEMPGVLDSESCANETNEIDNSNDETRTSVDSYVTCGSASEHEEHDHTATEESEELPTETLIARSKLDKTEALLEVVRETKEGKKEEDIVTDLSAKHLGTVKTLENVVSSEVVENTQDLEKTNNENEILTEEKEISKTNKISVEEINENVELKQEVEIKVSAPEESKTFHETEIHESILEKKSASVKLEEVTEEKAVESHNSEELVDIKTEEIPAGNQEKVDETSKVQVTEAVLITEEQENAVELTETIDTENQDDIKTSVTSKPTVKRYGRKRKNTSTSTNSNVKIMKMSSEVKEPSDNEELRGINTKELNITIKDIRDGGLETISEKGLLKPKEEQFNEKEQSPNLTPIKSKSEKENKTSETKQKSNIFRRISGRVRSPVLKSTPTLTTSSKTVDENELIKTRKKSIMFAYTRLMSHKYSNAFQKPITSKQVPGYENLIYRPMDLYTIKKKIDNRQITSVAQFQRDVLLMLNNAKMFNRINSQVYNMAVEVQEETLPHIQLTVQTLGEGIRTVEKSNEKIRKRQSLEYTKKDLKLIKRIKCSTKEDFLSTKKIKMEESDDTDHPQ